MTQNITLKVSDKVAEQEPPTRIKKGYYIGKLVEVKKRMKDKETEWENKYGKQLVFLFEMHTLEGTPVTITKQRPEGGTITENVVLPSFQYYLYKNSDTGELQTAITKNSRITKLLNAMGWTFDASKEINVHDFIGRIVEINVDDYEKDANGTKVVMSITKDIKALSEAQLSEFNSGGVFAQAPEENVDQGSADGSDDEGTIDLDDLEDLKV